MLTTNRIKSSLSSSSSTSSIRWSHHVILALFFYQIHINFGSPVFTYNPSVAQFHIQSGRNIRHLPCVVRRSGIEGVCMFAIDCIKANGTHLGTCIDRFYFGSCCQLRDEAAIVEPEIIENSIDQNTIPHFPYGSASTASASTIPIRSPSPPSSLLTTQRTIQIIPSTLKPTPSTSTHQNVTSAIPNRTTGYNLISSSGSIVTTTTTPTTAASPKKPEHTTINYVPITAALNTESKTEASNEQLIIEKLPTLTTIRDVLTTKVPTTTEENIKLQTFQSVQEETTFYDASTVASITVATTRKPSRRTTTTTAIPKTTKSKSTARPTYVVKSTTVPSVTTQNIARITTTLGKTEIHKISSTTAVPKQTISASKRPATASTKRPQKITTRRPTIAIVTLAKEPIAFATQSTNSHLPSSITAPTTTAQKFTKPDTSTEQFVTVSYVETTKAPRPKPKPTAQIVKIPSTDLSHLSENEVTPSASKKPAVTAAFASAGTQSPIATFSGTKPTLSSKKKPTAAASTTIRTKITTTTSTTPVPVATTQSPGFVTWTNIAENSVDDSEAITEYPPEWILIPSLLPTSSSALPIPIVSAMATSTTSKVSTASSSLMPTKQPTLTSTHVISGQVILQSKPVLRPTAAAETTRFPTRKPTIPTSRPSIITKQPTATKPTVTKLPATTKLPLTKPSSVLVPISTSSQIISSEKTTPKPIEKVTTTTTSTTSAPITTPSTSIPTKMTTVEKIPITTDSITLFDDDFEQTTVTTEISEMENTSASALTSSSSYGTTISKLNSTYVPTFGTTASFIMLSTTEKATTSSTTTSTSTTSSTTQSPLTVSLPPSTAGPVTITTHFPITDMRENITYTTVELLTSSSSSSTSKEPSKSTTNAPTTEGFEPTANTQGDSVANATTLSDKTTNTSSSTITSTSTTIGPDSVESSSIETNFTSEAVDLFTTEAISSTTSVSQFLETASYRQVCGKRMYPEPRIVGGSKASFGRWPWQISLRQWRTSTYLHKCGAALLNENWAITAAHCVDNVPPSDLLLRLGEYDLAEEEEPFVYQERRVQIVASHPQFDPRTFEYDLALLRFYEPVAFQPNIIPVCVPETDENFIGRTAFVTGWGRLYEDGPLPSVLQEVSVPVINNTLCEGMYRNAGYIEHIPHIFICAGWRKGGYDSCEGDSGGPMVIQRDDKRFLLAGVISWGIGCAEPNQPGVYTRISEFREWINQILQF